MSSIYAKQSQKLERGRLKRCDFHTKRRFAACPSSIFDSSLPFPHPQALRRFAPPSAYTLPSRDRLAQASRPSSCHSSQEIAVATVHLSFDAVTFDREPSTANALFRVVLAHRYHTNPGRSHPTVALSITVPLTHDYRSLLRCLWESGRCRGR